MNLLLDACTILWFFQDDPHLSATAKVLIEDPTNRKLVSIVSCWEIAIKVGIGKLNLGEPSGQYLNREITQNNFDLLPISLWHATAVETLPRHHGDPFDRLLIVQAQIEGLPILSPDAIFDTYGVRRLW